MLSVLNYFSSKRRLKESHKTIMMMGGREECSSMLLAQHEMIELEVDYYKGESVKIGYIFAALTLIVVPSLLFLVPLK